MKKIILTAVGFSFTLSILSSNHFIVTALNKGDGGAPQRPDLAYTHGETWSPAYDHGRPPMLASADGNHGGSPSYGHGNGGGVISNEFVEDPGGSNSISNKAVEGPGVGGGIISNDADGNTGIIAQV